MDLSDRERNFLRAFEILVSETESKSFRVLFRKSRKKFYWLVISKTKKGDEDVKAEDSQFHCVEDRAVISK